MKAALASSLAYRPKRMVWTNRSRAWIRWSRDDLVESLLERASEATIIISSHDLAEEIEALAAMWAT